ncbi:MAG: hypothetical protein WCA19_12450 [Candidatus Acidiferrales bacterium]
MNKDEVEIAAKLVFTVFQILKEFKENGRYSGNHSSQQYSLLERRCDPARGTAQRRLPDPNPDQRRKTDFDSKSKAA